MTLKDKILKQICALSAPLIYLLIIMLRMGGENIWQIHPPITGNILAQGDIWLIEGYKPLPDPLPKEVSFTSLLILSEKETYIVTNVTSIKLYARGDPMNEAEVARLQAKTKEQQLIHMLQTDYQQSPRMAQVLLEDLQACWAGGQVQPGQMRVMLVALTARHGQALAETRQTEVVWTVDAGAEDYEVQRQYGMTAVRQQRIQRLLDEAVAQGAVASQEDLARVLQVSVRTIKRDCAVLEAQGVYLPTRGHLKGIGRGQTHKALIVGRWLQGETYDQISRAPHHAVSSVQRYVQAFCRVMQLQQQGLPIDEIAVLVQLGWPLVADYQAIYAQHATPFVQTRLAAQLERLQQRGTAEKKRRS